MPEVLVCIDYKGRAEVVEVESLADAVRKAYSMDGCGNIIYGIELTSNHLNAIGLSEEEKNILKQVYRFQKDRGFRYGLRKEYIKHLDPEALEELREKKLIWILKKRYGDKIHDYVFLTRRGREIAEALYELETLQ